MTIGKFIVVFFTALIVNAVLNSMGYSFAVQMLSSAAIGLVLSIVDIASEQKEKK